MMEVIAADQLYAVGGFDDDTLRNLQVPPLSVFSAPRERPRMPPRRPLPFPLLLASRRRLHGRAASKTHYEQGTRQALHPAMRTRAARHTPQGTARTTTHATRTPRTRHTPRTRRLHFAGPGNDDQRHGPLAEF